jgi:hypothetical protein
MEIDEKIGAEALPEEHSQEHTRAEPRGDATPELPGDTPAEPQDPVRTPPEGRRWVKGQSGNPRGRPPSYSHKAAWVAQRTLDRKTIQLIDKVIGWGQGSDKSMLRLYAQKMVPPRPEVPVWLNLPPIENRADLRAAMKAVATGVAQGDITSAQGLRLVRLFTEIYRYL